MVSADGRSVIVCNCELYNFPELRRELEAEGVRFRSRTDTEVVLEALNRWGESAVERFKGRFAFGRYRMAGGARCSDGAGRALRLERGGRQPTSETSE